MTRLSFRVWCFIPPLACSVLFASRSLASQSPHLEELLKMPLEEMVNVRVTIASLFVESQFESGSTVSVIDDTEWEKRGARRTLDAIGHLPGVVVLPNWFGADNILVRGYADVNNVSGVVTLWDGVPLTGVQSGTHAFDRQNINLGTLDRIEMIRGPGSALYGENAFHGVLSLSAFESQQDVTRVAGNAASNGYAQANAKHSQALGEHWRLHTTAAVSGEPDQNRGYSYTAGSSSGLGERDYRYESQTAVVKLTSDPQRDASYRFGLYYDRNNSDGFLSGGSSALAARDIGGAESPFTMGQGSALWKLGSKTSAEFKAYYWNKQHDYFRALNTTTDLYATGNEAQWSANLVLRQADAFGNTQWSVSLDTRHADVGGVNQERRNSTTGAVTSSGLLAVSDFSRRIDSASFDANTIFADEKFQLRYGARVDRYSDVGTETSPRLGLIYHPSDANAVKLLYGHAFRAPAGVEVKGSSSIQGNAAIKPEILDTYELVFMRQRQHALLELVLFRSVWQDAITASTTSPSQFVNVGDSKAHGVELAYKYKVAPWTLETSGSWVQSENTTLDQDYVAFPKWIFNAGLGYRLARFDTDIFLNARAQLGADEGQFTSSFTDPQPLKDYWRADVHVEKHLVTRASVFLDVRNLFDRENYLPSVQSSPSVGGIPDEALSAQLGIKYQI